MTITLDPGWISDISMDEYSVGIGGTISTDRFNRFLTIISDSNYGRLAKDNLLNSDGSLKTGAEPLAALLICDIIQNKGIADNNKSETFSDGYSYTKFSTDVTKSSFLQKYEATLSELRTGKHAKSGTVRSDYEIEFAKLSQGIPPRVTDSSSNYPTI